MSDARLTLQSQRISWAGRMTAMLGQATSLDFEQCQIDSNVFPKLAEIGQIIDIRIYGCAVGDSVFNSIAQFPRLEQLRMRSCGGLTTAGFLRLTGRCRGLKVLELMDEPQIGDGIMPLVGQFRDLKCLGLSGTALIDPNLAYLDTLPLSEATFDNTAVSDASVLALRNPHIHDLLLVGTKVSVAVLDVVDGCPSLSNIYLPLGLGTEGELEAFRLAHPNCRVYNDVSLED